MNKRVLRGIVLDALTIQTNWQILSGFSAEAPPTESVDPIQFALSSIKTPSTFSSQFGLSFMHHERLATLFGLSSET